MLLAIETSSLVLSCALSDADRLIAEWTVQRKLTHSEQLIPHMDAMLSDAGISKGDITAVASAVGPGSFTGLRIGLATAKTIARIWNVPLIGVDTTEALAWNMAGSQAYILPLLDAQRGNVYAALYRVFDTVEETVPIHVAPIDTVIAVAAAHEGPVIALGESADVYKEKLQAAGISIAPAHNRICRAGSVAMAAAAKLLRGEIADPMTVVPNYIRRSEAEVLWEQRHPESR